MRAEAGLTQEGLAARADITTSYISRIERGDRNPTWAALGRLSSMAVAQEPASLTGFERCT